jgi:hypothetical protein
VNSTCSTTFVRVLFSWRFDSQSLLVCQQLRKETDQSFVEEFVSFGSLLITKPMRDLRITLVLLVACAAAVASAVDIGCVPPNIDFKCYASPQKCLLLCGVCRTAEFALTMDPVVATDFCASPWNVSDEEILALALNVVQNASALHGLYWIDDPSGPEANASACLSHLLDFMPKRDLLLLFSQPYPMLEFLFEHIRYALQVRVQFAFARAVPWGIFLDSVLPYAVINEHRDLGWRWRRRMYEAFAPMVAAATSPLDAAHILAQLIPTASLDGMFQFAGRSPMTGPPITWRSSTAPGLLSVQQVVEFGGSCTGTGVVLVAACRSVGVAARLAGCSESVVAGDDHHWAEIWDGSSAGPFGDSWHTREGVSRGNEDGPWDSPSAPMNGCLQGVQPGDRLHTLWASSWSGSSFMPLLWAQDEFAREWGFLGGVNRCGAYCTAWGCGPGQKQHYSQVACTP